MAKAIIKQISTARTWFSGLVARRPHIVGVLLAALLILLSLAAARIVKPRQVNFLNPLSAFSVSDFDDYFQASQSLLAGEDPYRFEQLGDLFSMFQSPADLRNPLKVMEALQKLRGVGTYLYPPFTAFLLTPLGLLDFEYEAAAAVFQTLSILALLGFLALLYALHRAGHRPPATDERPAKSGERDRPFYFATVGATLLLYRFLEGNAANGNIGFFLILLCGGGLLLVFRGPAWQEFAGGLLLGLAAVMKITPGFFGLVLIGGRRLVGIAGMGAGALLGIASPAIALGWDRNLELLANWYQLIVRTFSQMSFVRPWMNNQSLSGAIGKLFIPGSDLKQAAYGLPWLDIQTREAIADFAQGVKIANLALVLLGLLLAAVVAWRHGRTRRDSPRAGAGLERVFSRDMIRLIMLATLISLLVAGVSWYHAYSMLLVPVALRLYRHASGSWPLRRGDLLWLGTFAFFGIFQSVLPGAWRDGLALYSVFTFLCLAVTLQFAWQIVRPAEGLD